jgi:hypothetical protein
MSIVINVVPRAQTNYEYYVGTYVDNFSTVNNSSQNINRPNAIDHCCLPLRKRLTLRMSNIQIEL